jgi:hypothetical protein
MKYIDALIALAIMLLFAPVIATQYLKADALYRKSLNSLYDISKTEERINEIAGRYTRHEVQELPEGFRIASLTEVDGTERDAIFFDFDGTERHWILGR